ncbi:hypothetical protein [Bacillus haynesii]|nr:hypothetical protein [Bacillus haynesii]MEC1486783.1 hypothetical protein [Bacillus haynesii]
MPAVSNKGRTNTKVLKEDKKKNPFKVSHRTAKPKPIIVKKNEVKSTPQANITEFVPKPNTLLWMKMLDPRDKTDRDAVFERIYSLSLSGVTNRLSWMFYPFSSKTRPPMKKNPKTLGSENVKAMLAASLYSPEETAIRRYTPC